MSAYPTDQRCPRCQYVVAPGATSCPNCGLALQSAPGAYPPPPAQPGSAGPYNTMPASNPYAAGSSGSYGNQQPTYYNSQGTYGNAPTVASSLYPQDQGSYPGSQPQPGYPPPPPPAYPGSQPQGSFGAPPTYPGSDQPSNFGAPPTFPGSQPPGSFGAPPTFPGSQPPGSFGAPPTFPGSQPPGSFGAPPAVAAPPTTKKGGLGLGAIIAIAVVIVVLLAGGGTTAYILTRPKPTINVTSDYKFGSTPAGSSGTVFHVTGTDFSSNSTITFLLDGKSLSGQPSVKSDSNGAVKADLTVGSDWTPGKSTLTAQDASSYVTQTGAAIEIVDQGMAGTPGPNGAPPDNKSFSMTLTIHPQHNGEQFADVTDTLIITGQPDPNGGKVCQARDDGSDQTLTGSVSTSSGDVGYTETVEFKCTGTYKKGHLTYTETAISDSYAFDGGVNCLAQTPFTEQQLSGDFSNATSISNGTYSQDTINLNCDSGVGAIQFVPQTGDWSGNIGG